MKFKKWFVTIVAAMTCFSATTIGNANTKVAKAAEETETYDFVTNFATYASSWSNSYASRTVNSSDLGSDLTPVTFVFSAASKQTSNITNQPVTKAATLTITTEKTIVAASLTATKWTTKTQSLEAYVGGVKQGNTSTNFALSVSNISTSELVFKSVSGNQVGWASVSLTFAPDVAKYDVTFMVDGSVYETQNIKEGETATVPTEPTKEGFNFVAWLDGKGNTFDFTTPITAATTLTASFKEKAGLQDEKTQTSLKFNYSVNQTPDNATAVAAPKGSGAIPSETNQAVHFDLDPTIFDARGYNNDAGTATAYYTDFRLYPGKTNGGSISIALIDTTQKISSITITTSRLEGAMEVKNTAGVVTLTDGTAAIDDYKFTIQNVADTTSGSQIRITSITIEYSLIVETVTASNVGIRFGAKFLKTALDAIPNYQRVGTLIFPTANLSNSTIAELLANGTLNEILTTLNGIDLSATAPAIVNAAGEEDANGEYVQFAGVLTGVPESAYNTSLTAVSYVVDTDGNMILMQEATNSVCSTAQAYLTKVAADEIVLDANVVKALESIVAVATAPAAE